MKHFLKKIILKLLSDNEVLEEALKRVNFPPSSAKIELDERSLLVFSNFITSCQQSLLNSIIFSNESDLKIKQAQIKLLQGILIYLTSQFEKIKQSKYTSIQEPPIEFNTEKVLSEFREAVKQFKQDVKQKKEIPIS